MICETLWEPRLWKNGLFLGPLGTSPTIALVLVLSSGGEWRNCNLSLSTSGDSGFTLRSRCRDSCSFSFRSSSANSSMRCFRLRTSLSLICGSRIAGREDVSEGGKRSTDGDTVVRRGDICSSTGWYLDAISDTLIRNRGMSFSP